MILNSLFAHCIDQCFFVSETKIKIFSLPRKLSHSDKEMYFKIVRDKEMYFKIVRKRNTIMMLKRPIVRACGLTHIYIIWVKTLPDLSEG